MVAEGRQRRGPHALHRRRDPVGLARALEQLLQARVARPPHGVRPRGLEDEQPDHPGEPRDPHEVPAAVVARDQPGAGCPEQQHAGQQQPLLDQCRAAQREREGAGRPRAADALVREPEADQRDAEQAGPQPVCRR